MWAIKKGKGQERKFPSPVNSKHIKMRTRNYILLLLSLKKKKLQQPPSWPNENVCIVLRRGLICGCPLSHNVSHSLRIIDIRDTWSHKIHKVSLVRLESCCELYLNNGNFSILPRADSSETNSASMGVCVLLVHEKRHLNRNAQK